MRIDPAPSVPIAIGPIPAAAAAAAPPLEPPGLCAKLQGLRVTPVKGLSVTILAAKSGVVVLPKRIAPTSRRRAATGLSKSVACHGRAAAEPKRVGIPLT